MYSVDVNKRQSKSSTDLLLILDPDFYVPGQLMECIHSSPYILAATLLKQMPTSSDDSSGTAGMCPLLWAEGL